MVRYQTIIARFASTYPRAAWAAYDSSFRQAVANNPAIPWGRIHDELFDRHLRSAAVLPPRSARSYAVQSSRTTYSLGGGLVDGQRSQLLCFVCGRPGHFARACPNRVSSVPRTAPAASPSLALVRATSSSSGSSAPSVSAATPPSPLFAPGTLPFRAPQRQRQSVCFAFNEARLCGANCRWPHVCSKCFGPHPVFACDK